MATRPPPQLDEDPPAADTVTDYDLKNSTTYLRLLDAHADGAAWQEAARIIMGLEPTADPDRVRRIHDSHLARAQWMTQKGYRDLLERAKQGES